MRKQNQKLYIIYTKAVNSFYSPVLLTVIFLLISAFCIAIYSYPTSPIVGFIGVFLFVSVLLFVSLLALHEIRGHIKDEELFQIKKLITIIWFMFCFLFSLRMCMELFIYTPLEQVIAKFKTP